MIECSEQLSLDFPHQEYFGLDLCSHVLILFLVKIWFCFPLSDSDCFRAFPHLVCGNPDRSVIFSVKYDPSENGKLLLDKRL